MENANQLTIRMFGKFEMLYREQPLKLGHSQTTKAMRLLQLLLFHGEEGVHRSEIVQHLFGVDAEGNIQNNLKVIVHNLRKILDQSGLPENSGISVKAGIYRFTADCDMIIDAKEFENLADQAKNTAGEEQYRLLKEACRIYQGHFLPEIYGDDWVVVNSARYQKIYTECVKTLAAMMEEKGQYKELYEISHQAAVLYPLDEWQVYEMEALVNMGEVKEAMDLYDKTTAMYFEELSMPPSDRMMECFRNMRDQIHMKTSDISEVKQNLGEKEFLKGAFFCQYPSFADSYRMMSRMMERSGQSVYLLMCTIQDGKGQISDDTEWLKEISDQLYCAIRESLRRGDVFTRYNIKQYLVMLPGIREEDCCIVTSRIDMNFRKKCKNRNVRIHFHVSSLASGLKK